MANLRRCISQNSDDLAAQKAVDGKQDYKINKLDSEITRLEHQVSALLNNLKFVKLRLADIPDPNALKLRYESIKSKNEVLEEQARIQNKRAMAVE